MSIKIAQITDTHLLDRPDDLLRGWPVARSLREVLERAARHRPDYLLLTGDLADSGSVAAYQQLADRLTPLQIPTFWLPGNHDDLAAMRAVLKPPIFLSSPAIALGNWQLLLLDSTLPNAEFGEGHLTTDTLDWLDATLARHRDRPTLIALHHHPVSTGIDWVDGIRVRNAEEFLAILDRHPQVRAIVFGHIHMELERQHLSAAGSTAHFYGCPSTCHQVISSESTPDERQPGYRLLALNPDGTHATAVYRIATRSHDGGDRPTEDDVSYPAAEI